MIQCVSLRASLWPAPELVTGAQEILGIDGKALRHAVLAGGAQAFRAKELLRRREVRDAPDERVDPRGRRLEERAERPAAGVVRLNEGDPGVRQSHQRAAP